MKIYRIHLIVIIIFLAGSISACVSTTPEISVAEPTEEETPTPAIIEETSTPIPTSEVVAMVFLNLEKGELDKLVYGSAKSGELTSVSTFDIIDFPQFGNIRKELTNHVKDSFVGAWVNAGFDESLIDLDKIQIQAIELNEQDEYVFFLQAPLTDGRVYSFITVSANETGELIPIDHENLAYQFLMLGDNYDEETNAYAVGIVDSEGVMQQPVLETSLETGDTTLTSLFKEGGEAVIGNIVTPDDEGEDFKLLLANFTEIPQLASEAKDDFAKEEVVLRVSQEGRWQLYNRETEKALWELSNNGEWEYVLFETIEELLVHNDSLTEENKQLVIDEINNQFKEGLDSKRNSYFFLCVTTGWEYHDPTIKLPNGLQVSHTASCQYVDADGNPQTIKIPMFTYSLQEDNLSYVVADGGVITAENSVEGYDMRGIIDIVSNKEDGPLNSMKTLGYLEKGFVILVKVAMPGNQNHLDHWQEDYYEEVIQEFYTQELIDEFARTGNVDLLGNDGLLISVGIDLSHIYATYAR